MRVMKRDKLKLTSAEMSFSDAVLELASVLPASCFESREEIAATAATKGHIETLGYWYELKQEGTCR